MSAPAAESSAPVVADAPAAAPASADSASAAASSAPAAAAASASPAAPAASAAASGLAPLAGTDLLTKMMIDKSIATLSGHKAISSRGPGMLLRNLYGILFGPMFGQSYENRILQEEQKSSKISFQRTNEASLKRLKEFFTSKKIRNKNGSSLCLAFLNPSAKTESFEHRLTLIWIGGHLFKIDGMKRSGLPGLTTEQTSWPVACTECEEQGAILWGAIQSFIPPVGKPAKDEWTKEKRDAFDRIISQSGSNSRSIPLAHRIELQGNQTFVVVTSEEEGLVVDLSNGLAQRLKAITMQLEAMPQ